jgi:hypothetical protein
MLFIAAATRRRILQKHAARQFLKKPQAQRRQEVTAIAQTAAK